MPITDLFEVVSLHAVEHFPSADEEFPTSIPDSLGAIVAELDGRTMTVRNVLRRFDQAAQSLEGATITSDERALWVNYKDDGGNHFTRLMDYEPIPKPNLPD